MNVSVILAHPNTGSFNHAVAAAAVAALRANGHTVCFHDLYRERFEGIITARELRRGAVLPPLVQRHCDEIAEADGIIIVHPNWWGQPPAILKGWIDRVVRPGVAYEFVEGDAGDGIPRGLLKAQAALVFNTSNTPGDREDRVFGDPLETLWKDCVFGLCGITSFYREMYRVVVTSSLEEREDWLRRTSVKVLETFPAADDTIPA